MLEHLTVLQVRSTVGEMCRASSRFVYATTRFHPEPEALLDLTTDFEIDPTHITLLSKDFVRMLFVLEGFAAAPTSSSGWTGAARSACSSTSALPASG